MRVLYVGNACTHFSVRPFSISLLRAFTCVYEVRATVAFNFFLILHFFSLCHTMLMALCNSREYLRFCFSMSRFFLSFICLFFLLSAVRYFGVSAIVVGVNIIFLYISFHSYLFVYSSTCSVCLFSPLVYLSVYMCV